MYYNESFYLYACSICFSDNVDHDNGDEDNDKDKNETAVIGDLILILFLLKQWLGLFIRQGWWSFHIHDTE